MNHHIVAEADESVHDTVQLRQRFCAVGIRSTNHVANATKSVYRPTSSWTKAPGQIARYLT
jgi:hypothetical protein